MADTDPIYYFAAFVKDHALVVLIVGSLWSACYCESLGQDKVMQRQPLA